MNEIVFRKPNILDYNSIKRFVNYNRIEICDYSAANIILWSDVYNTKIYYDEDVLFVRYERDGEYYYSFPLTKGSVKKAVERLKDYLLENNQEFVLGIVEENRFELLEKLYPEQFQIEYIRDSFDYVYKLKDLVELSGKKYHGKKNHINKFKKTYDNWHVEKIDIDNYKKVIDMVNKWCEQNSDKEDKSFLDEARVMINAINNYRELNLTGILLKVNDEIVAATLGEELNKDTFVTHFEKALVNIHGAYPMINYMFSKLLCEKYEFVNREEDVGIEGLRKAKLSYHPIKLSKKGIVRYK